MSNLQLKWMSHLAGDQGAAVPGSYRTTPQQPDLLERHLQPDSMDAEFMATRERDVDLI